MVFFGNSNTREERISMDESKENEGDFHEWPEGKGSRGRDTS